MPIEQVREKIDIPPLISRARAESAVPLEDCSGQKYEDWLREDIIRYVLYGAEIQRDMDWLLKGELMSGQKNLDKPSREKIRDILHPNRPCFKEYPCPVPSWGACRDCDKQIAQILAIPELLIKDEDQSLPKYKAGRAVDTWIALERQLYKMAIKDMLKEHWVKVKEKSNEWTEG